VKFRCIVCGKTKGEGNPRVEGYSDGFCTDCARIHLIPLIRMKQRRAGNFDCFGKAENYCDQPCKYKLICVHD